MHEVVIKYCIWKWTCLRHSSPLIRHFFIEIFDTGFPVTEDSDDDDDDDDDYDDDDDDYDDDDDDDDYDNDCCKKITLRGSDSYPAG